MESEEHLKKGGKVFLIDLPRLARCLRQHERRLNRLESVVFRQQRTIGSLMWILFGLVISNFILGILALEAIGKGVS